VTHLGDAISALLDGELSPAEAAQADAHVLVCAECRDELMAIARMRDLVRQLPLVPVPRLVRPAARRPVALVAAAAAVVALAGVTYRPPAQTQSPPVGRFVQAHAASNLGDPLSNLAPAAVPVGFRP
jgi:anti-sigma factor RsiW